MSTAFVVGWCILGAIGVVIFYAVVSLELEHHRTQRRDTYTAHRADIRLYDQDEEPAA